MDTVLVEEFIGRDSELQVMEESIRSSDVVACCFYGIGGIGKTWLLRRAQLHFTLTGLSCAWCNLSTKEPVDFLHFLSLIRNQLDRYEFIRYDHAVQELQERLIQLYRPSLKGQNVLISIVDTKFEGNVGDIVGIKYENLTISIPKSELERLQLEMRSKITKEFVTDLKAVCMRTPVLILLDGYERIENVAAQIKTPVAAWFEEELLGQLRNSAHNLLFVITRREKLNWSELNREWRKCLVLRELEYFSKTEVEQYLLQRGFSSTPDRVNHLYSFTRGHPQCLAVTVDLLKELLAQQRAINLSSVLDQFREKFDEKLITEFLVARILDYVPEELSVLASRLSIPHWFNAEVIHELSDLSLDESVGALERLLRYSFVQYEHDSRYVYHDVVRDFLRARLRVRAPLEFIRLHEKMHAFYTSRMSERNLEARSDIELEREALYHLFPVNEAEAAKQFSHAFEKYEQLYLRDAAEQLLSLISEHEFKSDVTRRWVDYYSARVAQREGNWAEVRAACQRIVIENETDDLLAARAWSTLGRAHWLLDEPELAAEAYTRSADIFRQLGDLDEYGWNLRNIAKVHRKHGQLDEALHFCSQCRELFEASGDKYKIGWILKTQGEVHKQRAEYQLGTNVLEQSLQIWEGLGFEYGITDTLGALADVQRFGGRLTEAKKTYQRSLSLYRKYGDEYGVGWSLHGLGEILRMQGRITDALSFTGDSLAHFTEMEYVFGKAWNTRSLGEIALMTRSFDRALELYSEAESLFKLCGDPQGQAWINHSLGELYLLKEDFDRAHSYFYRAREGLEHIQDAYMLGRLHRNLSRLARRKRDLEEARNQVVGAVNTYRKMSNLYQLALCDVERARISARDRDFQSAQRHLHSALSVLEQEGDIYHSIEVFLLLNLVTGKTMYSNRAKELAEKFDLKWFVSNDGTDLSPVYDQ